MDKEKIEKAVKMILEAVGEDPEKEGLKETPERVARMYEEILSGYNDDAVEVYAKRLQLQERMTDQICEAVYETLGAKAVMVVCEAEHTCMTARGVKKTGTKVTSYATRGSISDDLKYRILAMVTAK